MTTRTVPPLAITDARGRCNVTDCEPIAGRHDVLAHRAQDARHDAALATPLPSPVTLAVNYTIARGGGTFNARTFAPTEPPYGYAVGIHVGTFQRVTISRLRDNRPHLQGAIARAASYALANGADHVGTWIDGGVIHVDPVAIIADRGYALALGRQYRQRAIWSFADGESIDVEPDGYAPMPWETGDRALTAYDPTGRKVR